MSPARVVRAACLASFASASACSSTPPPSLQMKVASGYASDLSCGADRSVGNLAPTAVRLSARVRGADGTVVKVCDALLSSSAATVEGFDVTGKSVDLYVDAWSGGTRLASGMLFGVDPTSTTFPTLRLLPAEALSCGPAGKLAVPRAFHTATTLPGGLVLLAGGLTATVDGSDAASPNGALYVTSTVEIYDPAGGKLYKAPSGAGDVARAFHTAAVVGSSGAKTTVLLAGGVGAMAAGMPVARTSRGANVPTGFRLFLDPTNAQRAPAELITVDTSTSPPTVTRAAAAGAFDAKTFALAAGAPLPGGGLVVAGGYDLAGKAAQAGVTGTPDGTTLQSGALTNPRAGAGVIAIPDATGKVNQGALVVGGVAMAGDMPSPFEVLDANWKATAASPVAPATAPIFYSPTLALLDAQPGALARVLVAGGLEVQGSGLALNPMSEAGATMLQVTWQSGRPMLATVAAKVSTDFTTTACVADTTHFKVAAWNAATLLPSQGRVLVTGGTPRNDPGCNECEGGDSDLGCAIGQVVAVSVPAGSTDAPQISAIGGAASMLRLQIPRFGHTQTILPDGTVLIAGGLTRRASATWAVAQTEIFNPARRTPASPVAPATIEPDDPLAADLAALGLTRAPGAVATMPGQTAAAVPCVVPKK